MDPDQSKDPRPSRSYQQSRTCASPPTASSLFCSKPSKSLTGTDPGPICQAFDFWTQYQIEAKLGTSRSSTSHSCPACLSHSLLTCPLARCDPWPITVSYRLSLQWTVGQVLLANTLDSQNLRLSMAFDGIIVRSRYLQLDNRPHE